MCGNDRLLIQGVSIVKTSTNPSVENNIINDWLMVRGAKCFRGAICSANITVREAIM